MVGRNPKVHARGDTGECENADTSPTKETGAQMVLANTYHLHLQPGEAIVERAGGYTRLWGGTDSDRFGRFQVLV